jgi:hypothetical protein
MAENNIKSRKTVTRTIRIDSDIDKSLEDLASKERTSVNFLINGALLKYIEWDYLAAKFGVNANFSQSSRKLLTYVSDNQVSEFARWVAKTVFKEYVEFWFKTVNMDSVLKAIRLLGSAGNFQNEEFSDGMMRTIICKHNMGSKWSLYYEEVFKYVFQELLSADVKIQAGENQVLVRLPHSTESFLESLYGDLQKQRPGR